jgi:hypothetical protein
MDYEEIKHPDYYNWIPGIECSDVIRHFTFNPGAAIKHIWRCGRKPGQTAVKDLKKAIEYLRLEIEYLEKNDASNPTVVHKTKSATEL